MPRPGQKENKQERQAGYEQWLRENPETHRFWPDADAHGKRAICQALVSNLKDAGLLSKTTGWRDVPSLPRVLNKLHGEQP